MDQKAVSLVFNDATITRLTQVPKTADSGYSLTTKISVTGAYSPELEVTLTPKPLGGEDTAFETVTVYREDGTPRRGFSSVGLTAYIESARVRFHELKKSADKPLLELPSCTLSGFSVSDEHAGPPRISFTVALEAHGGKAAKFLDDRKVYYGLVEVDQLQLTFADSEEPPMEESAETDAQMALIEDEPGEGSEGNKPAKKKKAPKKKTPAKKKAAPKKKTKGRERK